MTNRRVLQLRLIVEAEDYDEAVRFYRDVLGLTEQAAFEGEGEARVAILEAGRATLEIANPAQKRMIDDIEVGRQVAPRIRVAFEVADSRHVHHGPRRRRRHARRRPDRDTVALAQLAARRSRRACRSPCSRSSSRWRSGPADPGSAPTPPDTMT